MGFQSVHWLYLWGVVATICSRSSRNCVASEDVPTSTSSPEFRLVAKRTYSNVLPCLQAMWSDEQKNAVTFQFPDDAEEHHAQIQKIAAKYSNVAPYEHHDGFKGPWVENVFLERYSNKSLHSFSGLIPIFIPWVDNQFVNNFKNTLLQQIEADLKTVLRPSVIYLAISWSDNGLYNIGDHFPNILVISSAGYGHIIGAEIKGT